MELTRLELLKSHELMSGVDVPRLTEDGELLSISQRVDLLVRAYRHATAALIESLHTR